MSYLSLRDYGVIGNQESAVLISRLGSIDWCCLPYLDSASHFAALLDENQGGQFQICPHGDFHSEQSYLPRSNVLQTHFETPTGRGVLTDWMPIADGVSRLPVIYRRVEVIEGDVEWVLLCNPRFGYGAEGIQAEKFRQGILFRGTVPEDMAFLNSDIPIHIHSSGRSAVAQFKLPPGQLAHFSWTWGRSVRPETVASPESAMRYWQAQAHSCGTTNGATSSKCVFAGPWHDNITRSGLVLKLMTNRFSGAIAESVTTSLPSLLGGSRNWDYRYTWVRDSALAMQALINLDQQEEAKRLFHWLSDIVVRDGAEGLQPVYTLDGGKFLPERELTFLSGYAGSRPVRVGNLSSRQFSLDIYGHVMLSAIQYYQFFGSLPDDLWPRLAEITEYVCQAWRRPDRGPWEVRAKPEHFVSSKVLCWVAIDRACWLAEAMGCEIPRRWYEERNVLHRTICEQGFDTGRRSFVRAFGERELDASALMIPLLGFLPADDFRVLSTLDVIQSELADGVLVHRYRTSEGVPESDGGHLLCSLWFVSALALCGRVDEASDRLAELCTYATPLNMFGEQVDPVTGKPAGNFPSASGHLALINAALYVAAARGRKLPYGSLLGSLTRETLKRPEPQAA